MFTNLLYVGDVPVEASYHGSALLHRLLSGHPHEKLTDYRNRDTIRADSDVFRTSTTSRIRSENSAG